VGVPQDDAAVEAGVNWLLAHQQASGAWGESADSYAQPHLRGQGPATASQTAWAVLGLVAAGQHDHPATLRGVGYLLQQQRCDNTCDDGTWDEQEFTGTGFPRVFYLRYHMYRAYFPLLALAQWAAAAGARAARGDAAFGENRAQTNV
jgi:squalene-hopene/tetraprenyl-beta-curcumene cyclase